MSDSQLRRQIEAAVSYPLRHSEIADFRFETMIDNIEKLICEKVSEVATKMEAASLSYANTAEGVIAAQAVEILMSEVTATVSETPIPPELCGVRNYDAPITTAIGGCIFLKNHEGMKHSWQ